MGRLDGKLALITGAMSGIGNACATRFAREGARIAGFDLVEPDSRWDPVRDAAPETASWQGDVRDEAAVARAASEVVERFGRVDVLVNAAGVATAGSVDVLDAEEWNRVIGINLTGTFLTSKHVVPAMLAQGSGSIVNLASIEGIEGFQSQAAYNASKGGVVLLTRNMAVDFAPHGVRVNCLCPGLIDTPLTAILHEPGLEEVMHRFTSWHPIGRRGRPEEVAAAALFLASDDASFVTGVALPVDGGFTAGRRLFDGPEGA
ncbi:MAG TPA: SDR family NAD(P)-dependent oxidoreductase [Acidimicrobiia bacterium]|jgi:NAD(P)-dependent dehydrogenase (short-subunit alcohol dehydrogenase family)